MRLASFVAGGTERWGFVVDDPVTSAAWVLEPARVAAFLAAYASIPSSGPATRPRPPVDGWPPTLAGFLALGDTALADLARVAGQAARFAARTDSTIVPACGFPVTEVELLAPIPKPRLYWGLVTNAPSFVRNNEKTRIVNLFPLGHQRPQGTAVGAGAAVVFRDGHHRPLMAYNVELAVVIGTGGRYIPLERAMDHVAGYTVVNDVSGTYYYGIVPGNAGTGYSLPPGHDDWLYQATASWGGKKADTMAPMGPYLVTADEVTNPYDLLMYTRQSGRTRDRAHSGAAILGIERVIAWYSSFASLHPGDVIHFATMGVDGLPVPAAELERGTSLEVSIEDVGTLTNPAVVATASVPPADHPSYAIRAAAAEPALESTQDWTVASVRHFLTSYGNHDPEALSVPRFLNGPPSSLGPGGQVEIPPRATDLVVSVELAVVVRALVTGTGDPDLVLGYLPLVSVCDRSFADAVVEPARAGERGIAAMYGRWADGFNIAATPVPLPSHDWRDREMTLRVGDREIRASTSAYVAGPDELIGVISAMITLFPGDVITLGATTARLEVTREEYAAGVVVHGAIDGLGEASATLRPREGS